MTEDSTLTTLEWFVDAIDQDKPFAGECEGEATALVENFIGSTIPDAAPASGKVGTYAVPYVLCRRAVLEVGANLYYKRLSNQGAVPLDGIEPSPFRLNRNPMAPAYPLLRPFIPAL